MVRAAEWLSRGTAPQLCGHCPGDLSVVTCAAGGEAQWGRGRPPQDLPWGESDWVPGPRAACPGQAV